ICGVPSPNGGDKAARTWGSRAPESPPMKPEEGRSSATIVSRAPKVMDTQNSLAIRAYPKGQYFPIG
ncbi:MAG: hypothetical protein DRN30_04825, partial [Thermoplasmata archaeon]